MLAWAAKSETHTVLALFLVALALLLVAGVLDNVLSDTAKQRIQQALRRGAGAIGYGLVRTMLAVGKVLAFFLSESWFYGALADQPHRVSWPLPNPVRQPRRLAPLPQPRCQS
jgi:hypothetical protein